MTRTDVKRSLIFLGIALVGVAAGMFTFVPNQFGYSLLESLLDSSNPNFGSYSTVIISTVVLTPLGIALLAFGIGMKTDLHR